MEKKFDPTEAARKLGLSEDTVDCLLAMAEKMDENEAVLDAVDMAIRAVLAVAGAVWEDLDRYTDKAEAQVKEWKETLK